MKDSGQIFVTLKSRGHKLTAGRSLIIKLLSLQETPVSASELLKKLHQEKLLLNKTTVYRELEFLVRLNIIQEIQLGERGRRYELRQADHHHHLVCRKCKKIEEISSLGLENKLDLIAKALRQKRDFRGIDHSLEFFGFCQRCQS